MLIIGPVCLLDQGERAGGSGITPVLSRMCCCYVPGMVSSYRVTRPSCLTTIKTAVSQLSTIASHLLPHNRQSQHIIPHNSTAVHGSGRMFCHTGRQEANTGQSVSKQSAGRACATAAAVWRQSGSCVYMKQSVRTIPS